VIDPHGTRPARCRATNADPGQTLRVDDQEPGPVSLWSLLLRLPWRTRVGVLAQLARGRRELVLLRPLAEAEAAAMRARDAEDLRFGNVSAPPRGALYTCPCCGHATLRARGAYDSCDECGWEDDGQDDHDSHVVRRNGPNGRSLDEARARYAASGRSRGDHAPPSPPVGGVE
jgi:hypothetical protein